MRSQERPASLLCWWAAAAALVLAGCCRAQPGVPIDTIAIATVTWFVNTRGWKLRRGAADKQVPDSVFKESRQRAGFIFTRARRLLQRNPTWGSEPEQPTLRARLAAEVDQVEAAITPLVGTAQARGPLYGGTDPLPAERQHLDLGPLVTHVRASDPPPITIAEALTTTDRERRHWLVLEHLDKRRERVIAIGWRAAAVEDDVWKETGTTSQLRVDDLHGLVDRRLHTVELTEYRLSAGARVDRVGSRAVKRSFLTKRFHGAQIELRRTNSFVDDSAQRSIEPPSVPLDDFKDAIGDSLIQDPSIQRFFFDVGEDPYTGPSSPNHRPWFFNPASLELDWNLWPGTQMLPLRQRTVHFEDPNHPGVWLERVESVDPDQQTWQVFRAPPETDRRVGRPGYAWILSKDEGVDPAREIKRLFEPTSEWWRKPWLHADGAFSAAHLEALRFGLLRKTGSADAFNAMAARTTLALEDGFGIRGYAWVPDHPLERGRTEWFDNVTATLDELQVGDQVLVESLFPFLLAAWWEYPTCVISNIDVDPKTGRTIELSVAGFTTAEKQLNQYRKLVIELAEQTLFDLRMEIGEEGHGFSKAWDPGRTFTPAHRARVDTELLRKWSPYPHTWENPGPWWVWIHLDNPLWFGLFGDDVESVMLKLPKSVSWIDETHVAVEMGGKIHRFPIVEDDFELPPTPDTIGDGDHEVEVDQHRSVYVPLFEPFGTFSDGTNSVGWYEFLKSAAVRADLPNKLQPVKADGAWVSGLAGAPNAVRVIRARAKKP